ncbi:MAG: hypothetical protein KC502_15420 [Myxococcales bacterium]|nr:hypothetical protein [Myxococcales bacterium]
MVADVVSDGATPPTWVWWLGWSRKSDRIAWRSGKFGTGNRKNDPIWVARLGPTGKVAARAYFKNNPAKVLQARSIVRRSRLLSEQVGPADVLLRTRHGRLLAVVVRGDPPVVSVLCKDGGVYRPVAMESVRGPTRRIYAYGFESPDHRFVAVVATTGVYLHAQTSLFIVPLAPSPVRPNAVSSPATATVTTAKRVLQPAPAAGAKPLPSAATAQSARRPGLR